LTRSVQYLEVNEIDDKRNPNFNRGDGETGESHRARLIEYISRIEWQSEGHRMWYTHKNPYGCWICELLQIARIGADNFLDETGIPEQVDFRDTDEE